MSTGFLKKPSRPPPPPPIEGSHHNFSNSFSSTFNNITSSSSLSASKSNSLANSSYRKSGSCRDSNRARSDYIKISECHTGLPDRPLGKPAGFKSRASTSFSSTLKPTSSNDYYIQSSHQKSRSLTENHLSSTYLYLDLPTSTFESVGKGSTSATLGRNHLANNHKSNNLFLSENHRHSLNYNHNNNNNNNHKEPSHVSTVYKTVDFMKTDALNKCKVERTSGRGSDLKTR